MESPLPPDPYVALGVTKDTDTAAIKSIYRKLVLKCHPDKFTDEDLKAQKVEEFHKIQQAYELLVDEERRSRYDAQIRLCELRREALERQGSSTTKGVRVEIRTTGYDVRTAAPSSTTYTSRGTSRSRAEKKPSRGYDEHDRYYEESKASHRKDSSYEYVRKSTKDRERERKDNDRSRGERKKEQSKNKRKDHSAKYATVDDEDSDSYNRQRTELEEQRRRMEEESRRYERERYAQEAEERRRKNDEERRRVENSPRRKEREHVDDASHKYQSQWSDARDYIDSSKHHHEGRRSSDRPVEVRRSSARPRANRNYSSATRDRVGDRKGSYPEIVEFAADRKPPTLRPSDSSPANIRPPRSHTFQPEHDARGDDLAPPPTTFRRAETMPSGQAPSRRKESGKYRQSETGEGNRDSGYSSPGTPETQYHPQQHVSAPKPTSSSTRYVYAAGANGVSLAPDEKYRTVIREPERRMRSSPSPMRGRDRDRERDYQTNPSVRVVPPTPSTAPRYTTYVYPEGPTSPHATETRRPSATTRPGPGLTRAATTMATPASPERRGSIDDRASRRGGPLFGEINNVSYAKRPGMNDVIWAEPAPHHGQSRRSSRREPEFEMPGMDRGRPMMRRGETFAY